TYDLVSTHSKYAPSQAHFLRSLDELISTTELAEFDPTAVEYMRYAGRLLQLPRVIDSKIVLYRRDLFSKDDERKKFEKASCHALEAPRTWDDLARIATF